MNKLIDLGPARELTRGCEFSSIQLDVAGSKRLENGIRYRTGPEVSDGVRVVDPL